MFVRRDCIKTERGERIEIDRFLGAGGQGSVFKATRKSGCKPCAVKLFNPDFDQAALRRRIGFQIDASREPALLGVEFPHDRFVHNGRMGHVCGWVEGENLEDFLGRPDANLIQRTQLALAVAREFQLLHEHGIAHGDIQSQNVKVHAAGDVIKATLIDTDNFAAAGAPDPPCLGQIFYLAPELRESTRSGKMVLPSESTDRFSMAVMFEEILLLKLPSAGADETEEAFERAMCAGLWIHHPACPCRPVDDGGGYPSEILNPELIQTFSRAMSRDPMARPSAAHWVRVLEKTLFNLYCCPACNDITVITPSRLGCPLCHAPYPALGLELDSGKVIPLKDASLVIGRAELGGSPKVSQRHAIFRRIGPDTFFESIGRNGSWRGCPARWQPVENHVPLRIDAGDRIRLADVILQVIVAA